MVWGGGTRPSSPVASSSEGNVNNPLRFSLRTPGVPRNCVNSRYQPASPNPVLLGSNRAAAFNTFWSSAPRLPLRASNTSSSIAPKIASWLCSIDMACLPTPAGLSIPVWW